jgi:hypothetical protein
MADLSLATAGQRRASAQYIAEPSPRLRSVSRVSHPLAAEPVAPGPRRAAAELVHSRPAEAYKRAIATGATHEEALKRAGARGSGWRLSDLSLEERAVQQAVLERARHQQFRRVIRPELSKTGPAGCASWRVDRIYNTGDLMPMHPPSCNCIVLPIVGDNDPGDRSTAEDLATVRRGRLEQGRRPAPHPVRRSTSTASCGPVLDQATGDKFRGPNKVRLEDDPERAARMLDEGRCRCSSASRSAPRPARTSPTRSRTSASSSRACATSSTPPPDLPAATGGDARQGRNTTRQGECR